MVAVTGMFPNTLQPENVTCKIFDLPLDQSAAYILGLFQKKNSVLGPFWGNEDDLRGTKNPKIAPNFGTLFGAILTRKFRQE